MQSSRLGLTGRLVVALLSVAAVFVVSVVGAASASAHFYAVCETRAVTEARWSNGECTERGGTEKFATKELTSEEIGGENVERETGTTPETQELVGELGGEKIIIGCAKGKIESGKISTGGKTEATLEYSECSLFAAKTGKKIEACTVNPISASVKGALEGSPLEIKFEPKGENFTEITITGASCLEKISKAPVTGTQTCELLPWRFRRLQSIHCATTGSKLTFAKNPATFRGLLWLWIHRLLPWGGL